MIEKLRPEYTMKELCAAMEISSSGYYEWRRRPLSQRGRENQILIQEIKTIHKDRHLKNYGSPRMRTELNNRGYPCSRKRVARLMACEGITARHTRKWTPRTTVQNPRSKPSPNHLKKLPATATAGQVWVSDITYVFTRQKTYYLAVIMDLHTRQILGWQLDSHMESSLVLAALRQAESSQSEFTGPMFHSDRGCQYTSKLIRSHLTEKGYLQSMSAKGYCYDNAACESFFATLKKECFPANQTFENPSEARRAIFAYLASFYNSRRIHTSLGHLAPDQFAELSLQVS